MCGMNGRVEGERTASEKRAKTQQRNGSVVHPGAVTVCDTQLTGGNLLIALMVTLWFPYNARSGMRCFGR
jgi:hypothetical protein